MITGLKVEFDIPRQFNKQVIMTHLSADVTNPGLIDRQKFRGALSAAITKWMGVSEPECLHFDLIDLDRVLTVDPRTNLIDVLKEYGICNLHISHSYAKPPHDWSAETNLIMLP